MSDKALIKVTDLQKHYNGGEIKALDGVSIDISEGEVIVIIGPSGSGKSTLLRSLNLLEYPTSGSIVFDGVEITAPKVNINKHRQKMGMVFQHFNLFPHMSILKNLTIAPVKLLGMDKESAEKKALELLDRVGLKDRADAYPSQLSGGQKQRVGIARAIMQEPKILLCDEPTGALDYNTSKEILKLIEDINKKYGNTVIMVTHNDAIKDMADRVVKLRDGMIRKNYVNETKLSATELDW